MLPPAAGGTVAAPLGARVGRPAILSSRHVLDVGARWVVGAGGMAMIASIIAIFSFILLEVLPLWGRPRAQVVSRFAAATDARAFAPATDGRRKVIDFVTGSGSVRIVDSASGHLVREVPVPTLEGRRVVAAVCAGEGRILLASDDGHLVGLNVPLDGPRGRDASSVEPRVTEVGSWPLGGPARLLAATAPASGLVAVAALADGPPVLFAVTERENLMGEVERTEIRHELPLSGTGVATALAVAPDGGSAYVGSSSGDLQYWNLRDKQRPRLVAAARAPADEGVAVTALGFLIGGGSVVVGDAAGGVGVWFPVRDADREEGWRLVRVHGFRPHRGMVTAVAASPRDRGFLTGDATGQILLRHATSDRTLLELPPAAGPVAALSFAPKANGALALDTAGELVTWAITNPHPEVTLGTLFGRVWYDGYDKPEFVWQSTGGTDAFEPKLSLVPLIVGTLKGTLYALLLAVPLAVFGALYTSQFSHPNVRAVVKPTVELMAALPSVVLGLLAGLWLAPALENVVPGVLAMLVLLPAVIFLFGAGWRNVPAAVRHRVRPGMEALVVAPLIVLGAWACLAASPYIERLLFGGDFHAWLTTTAGLRFDQRNCLVVGFAMGFAVIPIIFTISEDALSSVPRRLVSASLALGATPWQTAVRIVLPTASAGIFSAVMIGLGRAIGETMIVLMATGNTPILDWNIFTGMRTMSANIAVEVPEAPHGGTLYRVLFLTALLLFIATFFVNTVAELVRGRLRKRFQQL